MKKGIYTLLTMIFINLIATAGTVNYIYYFENPTVFNENGTTNVSLEGCWTTGHEGEPSLPIKGGMLLLPPGTHAENIICNLADPIIVAQGIYISPVQSQHPLSQAGPFEATPANPDIYDSDRYFPEEIYGDLQTHFGKGYSIASFTLAPVMYNPVDGELIYYPWIEVSIETQGSSEAAAAYNKFYRRRKTDADHISQSIDNPIGLSFYGAFSESTDEGEATFLIITDEELQASFEEFAAFKRMRGINTEVILKEWIISTFDGIDNPDKIRNCIIDYYSQAGTDYVLLAGDVENIPKRSLYATVGGTVDADMAADLYFGCLDGNWNNDNDELWGEPGEADLYGEVSVGRAAVDSPEEAERFIHKQIAYQHTPVAEELTDALMLGEDLEWQSWGGDYKEEIRLGSSSWGYTTMGFPAQFDVDTLYDRPGYHWSAMAELLPRLNQGPQLINHLGHANNTYALKFNGSQVTDNNMTNDGINHNYYIIYSQGCYCNSWDNRTPDFIITGSDAIAETWTTIQNGAVCFIGNTRYGWGSYSNTNGSSQYYDREFFDAIFNEEIYQIGRAHQDSKEDCIPFINYSANRWCYYECCLLGDPTLEIWTDVPEPITVECDTFVSMGASYFIVETPGLEGALCAVSQNGNLLGTAVTNSLGGAAINFSDPIESTDPLTLIITKHNYYPSELTLDVYVPNSPNILFNGFSIDDFEGDNDGKADLGEFCYLNISLTNFAGVEAQDVEGMLTSNDIFVEITDDFEAFGNILQDVTETFNHSFEILLGNSITDGHVVNFNLVITDNQSHEWEYTFSVTASAPVLMLTDIDLDDGNDMRLSPGETADITATLTNLGTGEGRNIQGVISTDNSYLEIDFEQSSLAMLESGQSGELMPTFTVTASNECPLSANIPIYMTITDEMGYAQAQMFEIIVGGIIETFEESVPDWSHSEVTPGWNDEWVITDNRNFTPGGSFSWHCGPANGSNYSNNMDAGLVSPWYQIEDGAILTFRHWMNAETSQSNPGYCYDGGIVEIKLDTCVYLQIYPIGGYNYYIRDNLDMGPFPVSTPVYSGEIFWEEAVFDLEMYPNWISNFRFRFGSNSEGTREGWYIDDVELTYSDPIQPPANFSGEMLDSVTVSLSWNSPGSSLSTNSNPGKNLNRETDGLYGYQVYRNNEVIADNVGGLSYQENISMLATGTYSYTVTALFTKGESSPTQPFVIDWTSLSIENDKDFVPETYFADDCFPNPFNPETTIRFGLPEPAEVSVKIYNLLGREMAFLEHAQYQAGVHTIKWNAENMPSGIYFYILEAGSEFNSIGKMLLLK